MPGHTDQHAFISYVREDSAHVDLIQEALEAAGVNVWRDTADLFPGEDWRLKIRQAITNDALVFVACFSQHSTSRPATYQNEELLLAIDQLRRRSPDTPWVIPLRLTDCSLPQYDLGAGRTLDSLQRIDLFGERREEGLARLVIAVLHALSVLEQQALPRASSIYSAEADLHASATQAPPEPDLAAVELPCNQIRREMVQLLTSSVHRALSEAMGRSRIFDSAWWELAVTNTLNSLSFNRVSGRAGHNLSNALPHLLPSERLGLLVGDESKPQRLPAIRCAVPGDLLPPLAVLVHAKLASWPALDVMHMFAHTPEIIAAIERGDFTPPIEAVILTMATTAVAFKSRAMAEYVPLMPMPEITYHIVRAGSGRPARNDPRGDWLLMTEESSTTRMIFDDSMRAWGLPLSKIVMHNTQPHDAVPLLSGGDITTHALTWFPHHELNVRYNGCIEVTGTLAKGLSRPAFLFVHRDFARNTAMVRRFQILLLNAWWQLSYQETARTMVADTIVSLPGYMDSLIRRSGVERMSMYP